MAAPAVRAQAAAVTRETPLGVSGRYTAAMRLLMLVSLTACGGASVPATGTPGTRVVIDRFSARAGHILVRDGKNGLPGAGEAIDFEHPPFLIPPTLPQAVVDPAEKKRCIDVAREALAKKQKDSTAHPGTG